MISVAHGRRVNNSSLDPNVLTCGSDKEVNWKCSSCGFRWTNSIRQLYLASGECPCCEQKRKAIPGETDVFTIFPEAKKHYNFEKNREMDGKSELCIKLLVDAVKGDVEKEDTSYRDDKTTEEQSSRTLFCRFDLYVFLHFGEKWILSSNEGYCTFLAFHPLKFF